MIALPTNMPLIRVGRDSVTLCQPEWLTNKFTNAATGTNVPVWLAEDISRGVENYLTNHYQGSVIDHDVLLDQIDTTLLKMGLNNVAENMDKTPPPVRISLNELARRAGAGYELAFFHLLELQFLSAATGGALSLECHGLTQCVRRLSSSRKWTRRCDLLKAEIESFLEKKKKQAARLWPDLEITVNQ